ncbi:MAG TPA: hypothetical protein VK150_02885 [Geothrix sp.]|nr:hypothetical protein [Geothrix sp.]
MEAQRDQALALVAKSQDRAIRLLDKQNAKLDEQEAKLRTAEAQAAPQEGEALDLEAALGDLLAEHEDWIRSSSQGRVNPSERHTVIAARKALARLRAGRPA